MFVRFLIIPSWTGGVKRFRIFFSIMFVTVLAVLFRACTIILYLYFCLVNNFSQFLQKKIFNPSFFWSKTCFCQLYIIKDYMISLESRVMVVGPTRSASISIIAPKTPFPTFRPLFRSSLTKVA